MNKVIEFSELMNAKFCHDLSGPIGAISNAMDFLDSNNEGMRKKAVSLVQFSSKQAMNRLIFFRQAYGIAADKSEVNLFSLKELIHKFIEGSKINVDFTDDCTESMISSSLNKIIVNALIIMCDIMMNSGDLKVIFKHNHTQFIGKTFNHDFNPELISILTESIEPTEQQSIKNIQYFYLRSLLKNTSCKIKAYKDSEGIIFDLLHQQ